jgi:FMN reductase
MMKSVAVVGNPKAASRTRDAAERLAADLGLECEVVEVAALGAGLLGWGDPDVAAAVERVRAADVVIAASPTYKGTYTGRWTGRWGRIVLDAAKAATVAKTLKPGAN